MQPPGVCDKAAAIVNENRVAAVFHRTKARRRIARIPAREAKFMKIEVRHAGLNDDLLPHETVRSAPLRNW